MAQCLQEPARNSDGGLFTWLGASLVGLCDRCFEILVVLVYPVKNKTQTEWVQSSVSYMYKIIVYGCVSVTIILMALQ